MRRLAAGLLLCLAGAAVAASDPAVLARARAALEQRDFAAALPLYTQLVAADPANADLLIEAARAQGFADRNAEAARLYRQALAAAPARRADILPSLAWQTLWSGDAAGAVPWFDELSARGGDSADAWDGLGQARAALNDLAGASQAYARALAQRPTDRAIQRRRALALLWADRHDESIAALRTLLAQSPNDRDTLWSLANALNFAGRHRAALSVFDAAGAPRNAGERVDLARAYRWAGYDELAAPLLADSSDAEVQRLRDWRVARELKPYAYASVDLARDRDDLRSTAVAAAAGWRPQAGTLFELQARRVGLKDPQDSVDLTQLQGLARWRSGGPLDPQGLWLTTLSLRANQGAGWSPLTGNAHATWLPADRWRVDADLGRELIETPLALRRHISVDSASLGADFKPDARWTGTAAMAGLRFADDNRRQRVNGRLDYALSTRPRWVLGVEGQAFVASDPTTATRPTNGYWNPRRYGELRAFSALTWEQRPFELQGRVGFGRSREVDGDGRSSSGTPHQWELALDVDAAAGLRVRLAAGGSGNGLGLSSGGAGYWRRYGSLSLIGWF